MKTKQGTSAASVDAMKYQQDGKKIIRKKIHHTL